MKFLHNKFLDKYNIKVKILTMFISLIALSILTPPTKAYASPEDEVAAAVAARYNGTSDSTHGGNSYIPNGVSRARTGYLCYLLTKDGNTTGLPAYAFKSPGYNGIPDSIWVCTSRRGQSVSSWYDVAPWGVTPWENEGYPSNEPFIKNWMLTPAEGGKPQAAIFVQDTWGIEAEQRFETDEYILVIETIMNFQYSVPSSSGGGTLDAATMADISAACREEAQHYVDSMPDNVLHQALLATGYSKPSVYVAYLVAESTLKAFKLIKEQNAGGREFVTPPLIGTVPNLIQYKNGSTVFDSYTNKVAPHDEKIETSEAGFVAYTGGGGDTKLSDAEVQSYGVAMLIIHCKGNNAIHTYYSENGSPGKPEPAAPNKVGTYNIVKAYYTKYMKNGSLDHEEADGTYVEPNCIPSISVDDEPDEYHLEYWVTGSDYVPSSKYSDILVRTGPQSGKGASLIKLSSERNEKTVYVVLVRIKNKSEEQTDYNYLMTQSMISRTIWMDYPDNKLDMEMIYENEFTWKSPAHPEECEGHSCEHTKEEEYEDEETGETKTREVDDTQEGHCTEPKWEEHKINFSLYNIKKTNFPSIVATRSDLEGVEIEKDKVNAQKRYEPNDNWHYDERQDSEMITESTYETTAKKPWDYICVLIRGADKLTVAQTANAGGWIVNATAANEELANVSSEGFAVADTKTGMRKTDDYYEHFDNYFTSDAAGDYQTKVKYTDQWSCTKCGTEFGICYDTEEYTLSTPLSVNNVKVKIEVYSGNPNGGWENTDLDSTEKIVKSSGLPGWANNTVNTHSGRMVNAGNKISFLPYVLMKYQTRASGWAGWHDTLNNKTAGWRKAYVLGQYTRSINPNDYAEIHWDKKDKSNMSLLSNQWSTHALATDCFGTNNVLPGGATLGLKIKTSDRQEVYVTTLQCYTDGYGREQCEKTGDPGSITREDCVSTHSEFVHSVANSLDNTNVQQWQSDEVHDEYAWEDGQKVNRGESLDGLNTSGKRSSDDLKYYFGDLREGSNRGDYDVNIESTVTHTYTFYSDVNGAIHMTIDNTSPSEYEDDGAYSAIANAINERTLVRDKLIDAVEQSVNGDDTNKNDKDCFDDKALNGSEWYNEEFDGITVIVQETKITTGFLDPAERTEVLDPKLTQEQKSKGKQFGMEYDNKAQQQGTYELGQFKTRNYSENWGPDNPEIMAVFKGSTVAMHNLEYFYWTRRFWIPNLTVQDLY